MAIFRDDLDIFFGEPDDPFDDPVDEGKTENSPMTIAEKIIVDEWINALPDSTLLSDDTDDLQEALNCICTNAQIIANVTLDRTALESLTTVGD